MENAQFFSEDAFIGFDAPMWVSGGWQIQLSATTANHQAVYKICISILKVFEGCLSALQTHILNVPRSLDNALHWKPAHILLQALDSPQHV